MAYLARYKYGPKNYLASPMKFYGHGGGGDPCELWRWSPHKKDAHHFESRKAAKDMLRELRGKRLGEFKLSNFTFEPV